MRLVFEVVKRHWDTWLFIACLIGAVAGNAYALVQDWRGKACPDGQHLEFVLMGHTPVLFCPK